MRKTINTTHIEGILYEHDLELKVSGPQSKNPGTEFIAGNISIATDNEGVNIVSVHFTYTTATTSKGKTNATFTTLKDIIDGKFGTKMKDGEENAAKIKIDSAIGLNEFYSERNGVEELVSQKRNEGGFVHIISALNENEDERDTFKTDMVITGATRIEANEERQRPEKVIVKGYIFDFRGALLPVEFTSLSEKSMNYFESLEPTPKNPVFTTVWGHQISQTTYRPVIEENVLGDPLVTNVPKTTREFVITGASPNLYEWNDDSSMTDEELAQAMAERETTLAALKRRKEEYKAKANSGNVTTPTPTPAPTASNTITPAKGGFNF